jgi:hypothetical protein
MNRLRLYVLAHLLSCFNANALQLSRRGWNPKTCSIVCSKSSSRGASHDGERDLDKKSLLRSRSLGKGGKREGRRTNSSTRADLSFVMDLHSSDDIVDFILKRDSYDEIFDSWTSYDVTAFIRLLRDRSAYRAILVFLKHIAPWNVYVYTAAISALSGSEEFRKECFVLLGKCWLVGGSQV